MGISKKDSDIVVIQSTRRDECGGTDATLDRSAPKEIKSEDIVLFDVTSALGYSDKRQIENGEEFSDICYISAFVAKCGDNAFVFLQTDKTPRVTSGNYSFSIVKSVPKELDGIVKKYGFAKQNGFNSTTHGLPENFGGSVRIEYSSGERISFSDNQSPVIGLAAAREIAKLLSDCLKREKIGTPDISALKQIEFEETREGGFTKATLTLLPDGTATNKKSSQYDGGTVYESEKQVDADTVLRIKSDITNRGLLLWSALPQNKFACGNKKTLTFVFEGGEKITVTDDRAVPAALSGGFFAVELEMTVKH